MDVLDEGVDRCLRIRIEMDLVQDVRQVHRDVRTQGQQIVRVVLLYRLAAPKGAVPGLAPLQNGWRRGQLGGAEVVLGRRRIFRPGLGVFLLIFTLRVGFEGRHHVFVAVLVLGGRVGLAVPRRRHGVVGFGPQAGGVLHGLAHDLVGVGEHLCAPVVHRGEVALLPPLLRAGRIALLPLVPPRARVPVFRLGFVLDRDLGSVVRRVVGAIRGRMFRGDVLDGRHDGGPLGLHGHGVGDRRARVVGHRHGAQRGEGRRPGGLLHVGEVLLRGTLGVVRLVL